MSITALRPSRRILTAAAPHALRWALLAIVTMVCGVALPLTARAESTATLVSLRYVNGISNWGPPTATGMAKIWLHDGEVMVSVQGLPHLPNWQSYRIWLQSQKTGALVAAGQLNTDSNGYGATDTVLYHPISPTVDLIVLTVQPLTDSAIVPSGRRALVGYIASAGLAPAASQAAPATSTVPTSTSAGVVPQPVTVPAAQPTTLPQTGVARYTEVSVSIWPPWVWVTVVLAILAGNDCLRRWLPRRLRQRPQI